jgi:hypothetical protein
LFAINSKEALMLRDDIDVFRGYGKSVENGVASGINRVDAAVLLVAN